MIKSSINDTVEEIKNRCNIVDVIGQVVSLKKNGSNYKGLCPFHNEKTPSFVVSESKQIFTCFGCGKQGDVIEFVKEYDSLEFMDALQKLGEQCGVKVEKSSGNRENKEELYEINVEAAKFFYRKLRQEENPGMTYMLGRGLNQDTLKKFGIGFIDDQWTGLYDHLKQRGYSLNKLLRLGLISETRGKYYDKFRDRVMFPIINASGKVIGFGGRALGDSGAKYLNSQETPIFLKKNNLYGLNLTKAEIKKEDYAILVEGYMDVIALYQGGVRNVSATLGTALTENQARLIRNYSHNIFLAYDADSAGQNATLRGMDILYKEGLNVKVIEIPEGQDPDDLIKAKGKAAFMELVDKALPFGEYKLKLLKKEHNLESIEGKISFIKGCVSILKSLKATEADIYLKKIARENNISENAIRAEMDVGNEKEINFRKENTEKAESVEIDSLEKTLIKLFLADSKYLRHEDIDKLFKSQTSYSIYKTIYKAYDQGETLKYRELVESLDTNEAKALEDIEKNILLGGNEEKIFNDCIMSLRKEKLKVREKEIIDTLSLADERENKNKIEELTKELKEIQKKLVLGGKIN